jgi:hypothetical protein
MVFDRDDLIKTYFNNNEEFDSEEKVEILREKLLGQEGFDVLAYY